MKPSDLGLPAKFAEFRSYPGFDQLATAVDLATSPERFQILNAGTGVGKSATYAAAGALRQARWLVLVGTKGLQSQLLDDGLAKRLVWGHRNYPCMPQRGTWNRGVDDADADDPDFRCQVPRESCGYVGDVGAARVAASVVANYAYWMSIARYSDPDLLGAFDFLVLDEAHSAVTWLTKAVSITFTSGRLRKLLELERWPLLPSLPAYAEVRAWKDWALEYATKAHVRAAGIDRNDKAARRKLDRLIRDLEMLARVADPESFSVAGFTEPWIVIPADDALEGVTFSPRYPRDFAEQLLFRGIPHVLLTSATVTETHADWLGIPVAERKYREVPSPFDVRRRPIIWIPTTRVDFRMSDGAKWKLGQRVDELIAAAIDQGAGNGLLHTGSYERNREIVAGSKYAAAIITHRQDSADFHAALDRFKEAGRRGQFAVFASPRAQEGINLPDELGRWQAILKMPFPNSLDPLTKERARDYRYRHVIVAEGIYQMCGRLNRSMGDFGTTVILDDHWMHVRNDAPFAGWFRVAFKVVRADAGLSGFRFLTRELVARMPVARVVEMIGA